jgi:hypothetical protein
MWTLWFIGFGGIHLKHRGWLLKSEANALLREMRKTQPQYEWYITHS